MLNWGNISNIEFIYSPQKWEYERAPFASITQGTNVLSSWYGNYSTIAQDTATKRSGAASCLVSGKTSTWNCLMQDVTDKVISNGQGSYILTAYVKLSSGTDTAIAGIEMGDDTGSFWRQTPPVAVSSTEWTLITAPVNLTWTGTLTKARFYVSTQSTLVNYNVDDASMLYNSTEQLDNKDFEETAPTAVISMAQPAIGIVSSMHNGARAQFVSHVENAYELMDQPGEWYLDKTAHVLYYKQTAGQSMSGVIFFLIFCGQVPM